MGSTRLAHWNKISKFAKWAEFPQSVMNIRINPKKISTTAKALLHFKYIFMYHHSHLPGTLGTSKAIPLPVLMQPVPKKRTGCRLPQTVFKQDGVVRTNGRNELREGPPRVKSRTNTPSGNSTWALGRWWWKAQRPWPGQGVPWYLFL